MDHLAGIPCEVLEHIAFFLAVDHVHGPPSGLLPLLRLNRRTHSFLSFGSNAHLYSRIFAAKFDTAPAHRHFGPNNLSATALATELKRRCIVLKRIRDQHDCEYTDIPVITTSPKHPEHLDSVIWTAYLMMLENEGKNEIQLREFAKMDEWIFKHWFASDGTSFARVNLLANVWPKSSPLVAASMWLVCLFFRPENHIKDRHLITEISSVLKLFALGAHRYALTNNTWSEYVPEQVETEPLDFIAYGEKIALSPLPVGTPATFAYLSLFSKTRSARAAASAQNSPLASQTLRLKDCAWERGAVPPPEVPLSNIFKPGSIDGIWEGTFTYAEFTSYTELLRGAPPSVLARGLVAQHRQTWKIREHLLLEGEPLESGDSLRAFIPENATIKEVAGVATAEKAGQSSKYTRCTNIPASDVAGTQDIIITGDGHSAWGQFKLQGRVRPCDGFVMLTKEYVDGDRGNWLYRGHIVGGNFVGRWRDTMSPPNLQGYEGCFVMGRRG